MPRIVTTSRWRSSHGKLPRCGFSPPFFIECADIHICWSTRLSMAVLLGNFGPVTKSSTFELHACFLESAGISNILDFLWFPTEIKGCRHRDGCVETRHKFRRIAESRRRFSPEDEIAIMPLEVWERKDWENLDVCSRCLATMKRTHQAARDSLWTRLPEIFELPDWDCLEGMRAEALC
ncbi:hypothetical protein B0H11DRAFT_170104 [Mycena galericulata]|nr:hypothetical protein B0H11DRAFT_170104 [Mycena galericulata]